jgi:chaperonin GroEL (HSP60 family)
MEIEVLEKQRQTLFKHALVTQVELNNGKKTEVITLFNHNEVDFEEINAGINDALSHCRNVYKSKSTFCSIKNGKIEPFAHFLEHVWNR